MKERISPKADLIYGFLCRVDTELMQVIEISKYQLKVRTSVLRDMKQLGMGSISYFSNRLLGRSFDRVIKRKHLHMSECFRSPFQDVKTMGYKRTLAYWIPNRDMGQYTQENISIEIRNYQKKTPV